MEVEKKIEIFKKLHRLSFVIGAMNILLPIVFWSKIPEQIPMHYNEAGVVDHWADKNSLILLFFVIALLMGMMAIAVYFVKSNMMSKYSSEAEKSEMSVVYPWLILTNLVVQCMFAYMVFCSVTSRNLGTLFLPIVLVAVFLPIVGMIGASSKSKGRRPAQAYQVIEKVEAGVLYRSKVDWWLGLLLGGSALLMVYLAIEPIIRNGRIEWFIMLTTVFTLAIVVPLFFIKYVMYPEHLLVSCSIYGKERVRYADITGVKETMNPLSSAALSLHRIQIDYVEDGIHRMVLISPVRKKTFLKKLEEYRNKE